MNDSTEEALAIQEMQRTEGYVLMETRMNEEIKRTNDELLRLELDGRSLESVGAEYIALIERIKGLKRYHEIANEIKEKHYNY